MRERSLRELRQLQGVTAPEIAKVKGCGKLDDGGIYEVTEVVGGENLSGVGQLSRPDVSQAMGAIGRALLAAQKVGVMHRNLGAHMVYGTPAGFKVTGFAVGEPQGGPAFGPIDSIAPEQVAGKVVDQRTLIYNLAAIAQELLSGAPLFPGTPAEKLDLHANREAAVEEGALKRALSKDARMRPMMLKQFLNDLAKIGGSAAPAAPAAAPAASKPSTRGWTMFMEAAQEDAPKPAAPAPKPAPAPVAAPKPTAPAFAASKPAAPAKPAPAPAPAGAKPSTRGWTMFMEADDAQDAPVPASPAPAAPKPAVAPVPAPKPAAPAPAPAGSKPSTRGWTMFMEAEEGAADAAPAPAAPAPSPAPAAAAPVPAPKPAAPAPAAGGAKPSTR
ncbi:Serine/threonine protein kinase, partial [Plesiocystis pacifica SIR-1]